MKKYSIPVFMYHSVGIKNSKWKWDSLTIDYKTFERQLRYLVKNEYQTIHLNELYGHVTRKKILQKKSVVLSFDDGYLDNYLYAFPLLKKYKMKGTVFVNPEFVDQRPIKRMRLDQIHDVSDLNATGFLSWDEMREMESDGTIDIQSHAMTHTWYPISNQIIDFRHPEDDYIWMTWNDYPQKKPFLQFDDEKLKKLGAPVYAFEKSLISKRYFQDKKLDLFLNNYVMENGGSHFFKKFNWRQLLSEKVREHKANNELTDYYENQKEQLSRLKFELFESKKILEHNLAKRVDFLCWPGGSGSSVNLKIAKELGYKMTTAAKDLQHSQRKLIKNNGDIYPNRIGRTSPILYQRHTKRAATVYCDGFGMLLRISAFNSKGIFQKFMKGLILLYGKAKYILHREKYETKTD